MWQVSFSMVLQTLQLFNYLHFTMLCAMHSILEQSKRGRANPTISCSTLCSFRCFLRCKAFQSIAKEVLQTLQSVSCSIRCILIVCCYAGDSRAYQQKNCKPYSCSIICIFPCFVRCKAFSSRAKGALQTLQSVVQLYVFFDAFCDARHSRA